MGEHGPDTTTAAKTVAVFPAALCLTLAAFIIVTAFFCMRRLRQRNTKKTHHESTIFQQTRRPTAVRSSSGPAGQPPPHYLKKSPSPTAAKPLPGILTTSPNASSAIQSVNASSNGSNGNETAATPIPTPNGKSQSIAIAATKYTEENKIQTQTIINMTEQNGQMESSTAIYGTNNITKEYGKLGSLMFKLRFLVDRSALVVSVIQCCGLPHKNISGSDGGDLPTGLNRKTKTATDPYVKLQLLPEKQHKVKTRMVRNTRNPVYDEDFTFYGLTLAELSVMTLHFVVLSFDRYSRDDVIGEVVLALNDIDMNQIEDQQIVLSKEIQPRSLKIRAQSRGELLISLCWQPAAARLTVVLLKARNLPRMDVIGLADPYVKIYLLYNSQRIAKKKTHVKKCTLSPVFNESFAFDIPCYKGTGVNLDGISLELILLDWDRVTKNEVIGRLELGGSQCADTAQNHWNEVCKSPRRQIAEWHKLVN